MNSAGETELAERKVMRRGLLAGLAALGAAAMLKVTGQGKAEAVDAGNMVIGATNTENLTNVTFIVSNIPGDPTFVGNHINSAASSTRRVKADAIQGITDVGAGYAAGVSGHNQSS